MKTIINICAFLDVVVVQFNALPHHHLVAVVKLGKATGLTITNVMPNWWETRTGRKQLQWKKMFEETLT